METKVLLELTFLPRRAFLQVLGWLIIPCLGLGVASSILPSEVHAWAETPTPPAPSFLHDIEPILTRYGCNSGGCHGKLAGQNGFRLSLRGFAPEWDYDWVARESRGRRLNFAAPEYSLLLRKANGELPHGGGQRFETGSQAYRTLLRWIRAGAPGPRADEPTLVRLQITPERVVLRPEGQQPLAVEATYSDGSTRDVTWLVRFEAQDSGQAGVSADGVVRAVRQGESVVRAAFQGEVVIAAITVPFETPANADWYASRLNAIDQPVLEKLAELRIEPSPRCDDATFLRRAMLDTIGTLPTADEVREFLADASVDKREQLVERLLERPEFDDYWSLLLADLLQNRRERDHDVRGVKGVQEFHAWIRRQLSAHRGWDDIAREVLTVKGSAAEHPAVGYFIVTVGEKEAVESEVADSVAQAFLGSRIGCARCHNHPHERLTQDDYYHFAAFFSRVALQRQAIEKGPTSLHVATRHMLNLEKQRDEQSAKIMELKTKGGDSKDAEKMLQDAIKRREDLERQLMESNRQPVVATQPRTGKPLAPRPLDRAEITLRSEDDPREMLANWITHPKNELFAGAMVNRLWKHYLGVGLVEPVDDLRATNPPSNPRLWNVLVHEFVTSDFDLRHVMRLILNSRTYQLASDTRPSNVHDNRFYSHYYPRRLPAEVLLDAICQVADIPETFPSYPLGRRAIQIPDSGADSYFLVLFGRSARVTACACERDTAVTLPQLLHLQNGEGIPQKLAKTESRVARLIAAGADNARLVDELFLVTFSRWPNDRERQVIVESIAAAGDAPNARNEAIHDLVWALLNSKEFTFNR